MLITPNNVLATILVTIINPTDPLFSFSGETSFLFFRHYHCPLFVAAAKYKQYTYRLNSIVYFKQKPMQYRTASYYVHSEET